MSNIATKPKNICMINLRKSTESLYIKARAWASARKAPNHTKCSNTFALYPPITNETVLADIINRLSWYLPVNEEAAFKVIVPVSCNLKNTLLKNLKTPSGQARYIDENAKHIKIESDMHIQYDQCKWLLLWDFTKILSRNVLLNLDRVTVIDPKFYSEHEAAAHLTLYYQTLKRDYLKNLDDLSNNNFIKLMDSVRHYKTAWTFATGPSIEKAFDFDYSKSINIICNSMVKNEKLLEHIKPHVLFFADPVFYFSPCLYSHEFRRFMLDTVEKFNCYVCIPAALMPLYLENYPQLADKLIGMRRSQSKYVSILHKRRQFLEHQPSYKSLYFSAFNNILHPMLELASLLADDVYMIGADGRNPKENYFWKHNPATQFIDLMETAFNTHPSFFRDRVYTDYYDQHCETLEKLIHHGETQGVRYHSATRSYIPALQKRFRKRL